MSRHNGDIRNNSTDSLPSTEVIPMPKQYISKDRRDGRSIEPREANSTTSRDPDDDANSTGTLADDEEGNTRDLEASISGPPYTVFTPKQKRFIVVMAACAGFFSAISANIYFPALNSLSEDFHVSSTLINLTLTSYMIFQGLAPTFMGDLADMAGRRPAYTLCFVVYVGACIGIALCKNYASLLVLRCLQSSGSAATIALGSGVVADIATSSERGQWMGWATVGPMIAEARSMAACPSNAFLSLRPWLTVGLRSEWLAVEECMPALGPVIGGILAQFLGWRSIFWFLVILSVCYLIPFLVAFPETGRNVVGNGSIKPQDWNVSLLSYLQARKAAKSPELTRTDTRESSRVEKERLAKSRKLRFPNPLKTLKLVFEKDTALLLLYNSLVYTAFYDVTASLPYLFGLIYGYNDLQIGLCFIPFGVGCLIAPIVGGKLLDWNFRRLALLNGFPIDRKRAMDLKDFPLEKARIQVTWPLVLVGDIAVLCYGWSLQVNANLAAPLVLLFFIGLCLTGAFNCNSVMLVDMYPLSPSTATAANNLIRCWMGAGGTAIIIIMIEAMDRGWCFTFIAGVVALFSPCLWILEKWGPEWRRARATRIEIAKERKQKLEEEKSSQELQTLGEPTENEKSQS